MGDLRKFTVFYSHPEHEVEGGSYTVDGVSSEQVGRDAADELPEDWIDDDDDANEDDREIALSLIRDDLSVTVYEGKHDSAPHRPADYVFA